MDPAVLARIGNLELVSRAVVDGFINGLHKAPYFGASVDFAEHRGYVPGDDIRRMDWRLWARTDRYYIKEYEAESNMNFSVLLDVSKSMDYGSRGITKLDYARILDRVPDQPGAPPARPRRLRRLRQRRRRVRAAVGQAHGDGAARAGSAEAGPAGQPEGAAAQAGRALRPPRRAGASSRTSTRTPRRCVEAVTPLRFRGNDLIVFHVLDPAELEFGFADAQPFEDLETGEQMPVVPEAFREEYRSLVQAHIDALRSSFSKVRVDYTLLDTSKPLDHALFRYLSGRSRDR